MRLTTSVIETVAFVRAESGNFEITGVLEGYITDGDVDREGEDPEGLAVNIRTNVLSSVSFEWCFITDEEGGDRVLVALKLPYRIKPMGVTDVFTRLLKGVIELACA
ncbi:uncharacterized protein A4U43_C03F9150 [Asparagus officinalis]|uniref:Uncharacterized protein n=1 Tax=Asparagus officinalis TaxID=4686 RepID=A0A5P1FDL0_ASPOF|nr:uncharacterized protein A4U43_C03F9150 [Asparagus officinalis]